MSSTSISFHRVVSIETKYKTAGETKWREIIIRDESGEELEVAAFADRNADDLNIRHMDAYEVEELEAEEIEVTA